MKGHAVGLAGTSYHVMKIDSIVPGNFGVEAFGIVVPDIKILEKFGNYYMTTDIDHNTYNPTLFRVSAGWNAKPEDQNAYQEVAHRVAGANYEFESKTERYQFQYSVNGGFYYADSQQIYNCGACAHLHRGVSG